MKRFRSARMLVMVISLSSVAAPGAAPKNAPQGSAIVLGDERVITGSSARFGFTRLVVNDLAKETRFYQTVFGYPPPMIVSGDINRRSIKEAIFFGSDGSIDFIILVFTDGSKAPRVGMISSFATPDLEQLRSKVVAEGGAIYWDIRPLNTGKGITRSAFFTDPEGHMFQAIEK